MPDKFDEVAIQIASDLECRRDPVRIAAILRREFGDVERLRESVLPLVEEVEDLANGLLTANNDYDKAMGRGWLKLVEPVRAALQPTSEARP